MRLAYTLVVVEGVGAGIDWPVCCWECLGRWSQCLFSATAQQRKLT